MRFLFVFILFMLIVGSIAAQDITSPQAAGLTFHVNTFLDTVDTQPGDARCLDAVGKCSLRAAVMEGNYQPYRTMIDLKAGTYILTITDPNFSGDATDDLDIYTNITIIGGGAGRTVIDVNGLNRAFYVGSYSTPNLFELRGVEIKNGNGVPNSDRGGVIYVAADSQVVMDDVYFHNNTAESGGAIDIGEGDVTITNSTISANTSTERGGGINLSDGSLTLYDVTISGNTAQTIGGGGIFIAQETFLTMTATTIAFNTVVSGSGGGLYSAVGNITANRVLFANNTAPTSPNCVATFAYGGNNLLTNIAGCTVRPGDLVNANAQIAALAVDPLGSTPTHALLPSSPAVNAAGTTCAGEFDQRGLPRRFSGGSDTCDIGAYEYLAYTNVITNGDFEIKSVSNATLPESWNASGLTNDRLVCNKIEKNKIQAFKGNCAMQFNGAPGKNAQLVQNADVSNIHLGDLLLMFVRIKGKNATNGFVVKGANVQFKLTYADTTSEKRTISSFAGTFDYDQSYNYTFQLTKTVTKLKVTVGYKGASGSITVDDLILMVVPTDLSPKTIWMALPAQP